MPATFAKVLTAPVPAAIAVIAVEGPETLRIVNGQLFTSGGQPKRLEPGRVTFAFWHFHHSPLPPEHVVVVARQADLIEINCHGGPAIIQAILAELHQSGCPSPMAEQPVSQAQAGCRWAIEQAAEQALIQAPTLKVASLLLDQLQGALAAEIDNLQSALADSNTFLVEEIRQRLLNHGQFGIKLRDGWRLTLAGPPNVGKSSLLNALCGQPRALVHEQPGTTRDAIDTRIVIADWPLILTDTAGIRQTEELIERHGIETATARWQAADIGLLVVDAMVGWTEQHAQLQAARRGGAMVVVLNKCDRVPAHQAEPLCRWLSERSATQVVRASATIPGGIDDLIAWLGQYLDSRRPADGSAVPFTTAQLQWIEQVGHPK